MAPAVSRIAAPAPQSAVFPNEILGLIGKNLNPFCKRDRNTLRALTAVSRSCYHLNFPDANHCIVLYGDSMAEEPFGVHPAFLEAPQQAHLLPVIFHLELCGVKGRRNRWDPLTYSELNIPTFLRILRLIPGLQSITLSGVQVTPSDNPPTLLPPPRFPFSMTALTSHHATFTMEAIELLSSMLRGSSVHRLALLQVEWTYTQSAQGASFFSAAQPGVLQLHTPQDPLLGYCSPILNCRVIGLWGLETWDIWRVKWMLEKSREFLERLDLGLLVDTNTNGACYVFIC